MDSFIDCIAQLNIDISNEQLDLFERYYELLISWNEKINLTAITDKQDVYIKHFADSISVLKYIDLAKKSIIDIGTGGGFPGIPIKIMCPDSKILLLDSLAKRVGFLNEVISSLGLNDISAIHGRAEDIAFEDDHREKYDIAVSRAVANLSTLSEYCLPFVNINGVFISYKSGNIDDELSGADKAINVLGGKTGSVEKFILPGTDYDRSLVFINKVKKTEKKYPRKAGTPQKKPLGCSINGERP